VKTKLPINFRKPILTHQTKVVFSFSATLLTPAPITPTPTMAISLKEKEIRRAKDRARQQLYRQKKKASMTEEERAKQRAKATAKNQSYLQKKKASMTEEEMTKQRADDATKKRLYRKKKKDEESESIQNRDRKNSFDYKIPVDIKGPIQQACNYDQKEIMKVDGNPNAFRVAVCVLCDRLIIGCEAIHKITVESFRSELCESLRGPPSSHSERRTCFTVRNQ